MAHDDTTASIRFCFLPRLEAVPVDAESYRTPLDALASAQGAWLSIGVGTPTQLLAHVIQFNCSEALARFAREAACEAADTEEPAPPFGTMLDGAWYLQRLAPEEYLRLARRASRLDDPVQAAALVSIALPLVYGRAARIPEARRRLAKRFEQILAESIPAARRFLPISKSASR